MERYYNICIRFFLKHKLVHLTKSQIGDNQSKTVFVNKILAIYNHNYLNMTSAANI